MENGEPLTRLGFVLRSASTPEVRNWRIPEMPDSASDGRLRFLSTPEEKCIGFPEQKYISEAGKKGR